MANTAAIASIGRLAPALHTTGAQALKTKARHERDDSGIEKGYREALELIHSDDPLMAELVTTDGKLVKGAVLASLRTAFLAPAYNPAPDAKTKPEPISKGALKTLQNYWAMFARALRGDDPTFYLNPQRARDAQDREEAERESRLPPYRAFLKRAGELRDRAAKMGAEDNKFSANEIKAIRAAAEDLANIVRYMADAEV